MLIRGLEVPATAGMKTLRKAGTALTSCLDKYVSVGAVDARQSSLEARPHSTCMTSANAESVVSAESSAAISTTAHRNGEAPLDVPFDSATPSVAVLTCSRRAGGAFLVQSVDGTNLPEVAFDVKDAPISKAVAQFTSVGFNVASQGLVAPDDLVFTLIRPGTNQERRLSERRRAPRSVQSDGGPRHSMRSTREDEQAAGQVHAPRADPLPVTQSSATQHVREQNEIASDHRPPATSPSARQVSRSRSARFTETESVQERKRSTSPGDRRGSRCTRLAEFSSRFANDQ